MSTPKWLLLPLVAVVGLVLRQQLTSSGPAENRPTAQQVMQQDVENVFVTYRAETRRSLLQDEEDAVKDPDYDDENDKHKDELVRKLVEKLNRTALNPVPSKPEERCALTQGTWCMQYHTQEPVQRYNPPYYDKDCPNDCNGVGQCNHETGLCHCPAGWGGPDCTQPRKRACHHMGADKRDAGWHNLTHWSHTRCAGVCDDNIAMCYCPPDTKYGRREAADPKLPPLQAGRPLFMCTPGTDKDGKKVEWGGTPYEDMFGDNGWCNADRPKFTCPCRLDGLAGTLCDEPIEQTCVNQCSGHGDCNLGFCKCHKGWYGVDCGLRRKGVYLTDGDQVTSKPWMQGVVTPAVATEDPPMTPYRRRPYVYVYDMKSDFGTDFWQYRIEAAHCVYRQYEPQNKTVWVGYNAYAAEPLLHELFLTSEHRTLNPEEADFFYVPISVGCLMDVYGWNSVPRWPTEVHGPRTYGAAMMQREAMKWIAETFPYFKRNGGKDHIWFMPHDEGACYVWKDIWPGVMLSHWGRMDMPHASRTAYGQDNYSLPLEHTDHPGNWLDHTSKAHPCFDPKKDLVIPAFKPPSSYKESPFMGSPVGQKRDILAFFLGDLRLEPGRDPNCMYSRCLRQRIYNMSTEGKWKETHNIMYGDRKTIGNQDYSTLLAKSTFCFVLPGDGWSPRFEDAVLHGCIPVIIMDQVQTIFESILDVASISIRIPEAEISKIPEIIKAVPADKIAKMQEGIARTWQRFRYIKLKMVIEDARKVLAGHMSAKDGTAPKNLGAAYSVSKQDDAFATIMQWLYSRIPDATGKPLVPAQSAVVSAGDAGAAGAATAKQ